ncbi:Glutaminyl-peptide cyclotransferase [Sulfidibacter corallicola]|uniref:Glutaminyl-peptide cyclotransferase n=1 Tax=Sulfidibacter corallicola TaxID=2818388 RepID=A0A8A4TS69_SULCO|nr:glutaminyl-peptide cyclotransferase [Sulfidibacter corallicola]QTD51994.1 glutaminyl-peptide cyclotransferase [Sulfidibacter corallicola]
MSKKKKKRVSGGGSAASVMASEPRPAAKARRSWLVGLLVVGVLAAIAAPLVFQEETTQTAGISQTPTRYRFKVVRKIPHDPQAYTQGLLVHEGHFYESTGLNGQSSVRRLDPDSGSVLLRRDLDARYFGEGLHFYRGVLMQLTWRAGELLIYDSASLEPLRSYRYQGEGWGLTGSGDQLFRTDGTSRLHVHDAGDFSLLRSVTVRQGGREVGGLNELEWIDGRVWANVYGTNRVVIIDPEKGDVTGSINFSGLLERQDRHGREDVLNGIAHDKATGRIFVTGKRYAFIYEVELEPLSSEG